LYLHVTFASALTALILFGMNIVVSDYYETGAFGNFSMLYEAFSAYE
jgi:hypothetical protein